MAACGPESRAWQKAQSENSVEAYEAFMVEFPESDRASDATARIHQLEVAAEAEAWQAARQGSLADLRGFLRTYRESAHREEAEKRFQGEVMRVAIENLRQLGILSPEADVEELLALVEVERGADELGRGYVKKSWSGSFRDVRAHDALVVEQEWLRHLVPFQIAEIQPLEKEEPESWAFALGGVSRIDAARASEHMENVRASVGLARRGSEILVAGAPVIASYETNTYSPIIPMGDRSTWRFEGKVEGLLPGITFESTSDGEDRLLFVLVAGSGLTYVSGNGRVSFEGGPTVELPDATLGNAPVRHHRIEGTQRHSSLAD